jgi:hypothetical protein
VRKDPKLAAQVARAWELRQAGPSYRVIHDEVQFYRSTKCYSTFFSNPLFAGILDYAGQRYPEGWREGKRFCEPYISLEQFGELQARSREWTQRQGVGPGRHPRNRMSMYLLSGLVVCGYSLNLGLEVSVVGWQDPRTADACCYRCGRKQRVRGSACTLRSVVCRRLEDTVIETIRGAIFTPEYIQAEVAQANAALAERSGNAAHEVRQAESAVASARKALENLARFVASHSSNPIIDEQYQRADREWRSASAALTAARAQRQDTKPLRVTEAKAPDYAANLALHMQEGDIALHRRFLSAFIRRIVLCDVEGTIELTEQAAFEALHAVEEASIPQTLRGTPLRRQRRYAPRLLHARVANIPMDGTPDGELSSAFAETSVNGRLPRAYS